MIGQKIEKAPQQITTLFFLGCCLFTLLNGGLVMAQALEGQASIPCSTDAYRSYSSLMHWSPMVMKTYEKLLELQHQQIGFNNNETDEGLNEKELQEAIENYHYWTKLSLKWGVSKYKMPFISWSKDYLSNHEKVLQINQDNYRQQKKIILKEIKEIKAKWKKQSKKIISQKYLLAPEDKGKFVRAWDSIKKMVKRKKEEPGPIPLPFLKEIILKGNEQSGKDWVEKKGMIQTLGTSVNNVFFMKNEDGQKVAVFKAGRQKVGSQHTAIVETLTWNLAALLGQESFFAPTKTSEVNVGLTIREKDVLKNIPKDKVQGGIQNFQNFVHYMDVISYPDYYSKYQVEGREYARANLLTIIFGMWDAHGNNIGVRQKGKVIFYDNGRSLPHSNDFINWDGLFYVPFRSALIHDSTFFKKISVKKRFFLLNELDKMQEKIPKVKAYLLGRVNKELIAKLPEGWWNSELVVKALEERIARMKLALLDPQVKNYADVVAKVFPFYKFIMALKVATFKGETELKVGEKRKISRWFFPLNWLLQQSNHRLQHYIEIANDQGIDVEEIYQMSQESQLSLEDFSNVIMKKYFPKKFPDISAQGSMVKSAKNTQFVQKIIKDKLVVDNKDKD